MAGTGLQPAVIAITFTFPACSLLIVSIRFWRKAMDRSFGGDDAVLAVAMALAVAYCLVDYTYIKLACVGLRDEDLVPMKPSDIPRMLKLLYVESIIYNPILCLVKASFLWTLMKLRSPRIWLNRALWAIQVINGVYMVGSTFASIFACNPVKAKWDFEASLTAKCYDIVAYVIGSICIVLFTDIMVLGIPTWMIYDLHMPLSRKLITISFLSLGLAVTAIGGVRLNWMISLFVYHRNPSYSIAQTYSTMESNIAIIGACGPTVKWILSRCIPSLDHSRKSSNTNYYNTYNVPSSARSRGRRRTYTGPTNGTFLSTSRSDEDRIYMGRDQETMELRDAPNWRHHQSFVEVDKTSSDMVKDDTDTDASGILKTVGWDVASGKRGPLATPAQIVKKNKSDRRLAVSPRPVL